MPARTSPVRRTFVVTAVVLGTLLAAIVLWKLRMLVALLFLSFMLASAMRPGVEWLARFRVPRVVGVLAHYAVLVGLVGVFLWLVVPSLLTQVGNAIGNVPQTRAHLKEAARNSTGVKHEVLLGLQRQLAKLPKAGDLVHTAINAGKQAIEVLVGLFFVLAAAAYWIFERDRAVGLVVSLLPRTKRRLVRDTWDLVELKLGAYVRAQMTMITFVGTVLSLAFWQIGLPYWLLIGILAGVVEIVPVVGPLAAGAVAVGIGLTVSVQAAALAAVAVYGLRLIQDYVLGPRVLGGTVGLPPLAVLVVVFAVGLLLGGAYVPLAIPFPAVAATLADVLVRGREPAEEEVPTVLFKSGTVGEYRRETAAKPARKRPPARA
jgi:predicted PurR-regulated permease PerM